MTYDPQSPRSDAGHPGLGAAVILEPEHRMRQPGWAELYERERSRLVALLRPEAYSKCDGCGSTLMTRLDWQLHTAPDGSCITYRRSVFKDETNALLA